MSRRASILLTVALSSSLLTRHFFSPCLQHSPCRSRLSLLARCDLSSSPATDEKASTLSLCRARPSSRSVTSLHSTAHPTRRGARALHTRPCGSMHQTKSRESGHVAAGILDSREEAAANIHPSFPVASHAHHHHPLRPSVRPFVVERQRRPKSPCRLRCRA